MLVGSAYTALHFREDEDYVVKPVEGEGFCKKEIVIVDKGNTGRLAEKSRWQHGLHQFLELRHQLPAHEESLLISSLCHPVYFSFYKKIYGLTGTIGIKVEEDEIRDMYRVGCFKIPPHRNSQRQDLQAVVCRTRGDYEKTIIAEITKMIAAQRPTLILLETIEQSENMQSLFKRLSIDSQILNARQAEDESYLIAKAGMPGSVTIATNTAGRGTDIALAPESLVHGGLHVIFGYMPDNDRVEMQGFGRAARQGQPGSTRMIILIEESLLQGLEEFGFRSSDLDSIEYALLRRVRDCRIKKASSYRRFQARVEIVNQRFHQKFVAQFAAWQEFVYKRKPHAVIVEAEIKSKKEFATRFYNRLDELFASVRASAADTTSILAKYVSEIERLYDATRQFWEEPLNAAKK